MTTDNEEDEDGDVNEDDDDDDVSMVMTVSTQWQRWRLYILRCTHMTTERKKNFSYSAEIH